MSHIGVEFQKTTLSHTRPAIAALLTLVMLGCGGGAVTPLPEVVPTDLGGPSGVFGKTLCVNADPTSATPLYTRLETLLGSGAVEAPSDVVYVPTMPHVTEGSNGSGGTWLNFLALEPTDVNLDGSTQDRSRTEIKISPVDGPQNPFKAHEGDVFVVQFRLRIDSAVKFSRQFTHLHQIQASSGTYTAAPIVTLTVSNGRMVVRHTGDLTTDTSSFTTLGTVPIESLQGRWVDVREEMKFSNVDGFYKITITPAGSGTPVLSINQQNLSMWRTGSDHIRPKFGVYRKHDADLNQRVVDVFSYSNLAITNGATPDATCR